MGEAESSNPTAPPIPAIAISYSDTPNADELGFMFLRATGELPDRTEGTIGTVFFESCTTVFESPGGDVTLFELPRRFIDAVAQLDDTGVSSAATAANEDDSVPMNPFTKEPIASTSQHRARIRETQAALDAELRGFRAFFRAARDRGERVWIWSDLRPR